MRYFLKKCDEVDFFHADKHQNLLQIDAMILMWIVKKLEIEFILCMQMNIKVSASWYYCF